MKRLGKIFLIMFFTFTICINADMKVSTNLTEIELNKIGFEMSFIKFNKPMWFSILPEYFQPSKTNIQKIEFFRNKYSLQHDILAQMISMTPWSVKKLQWFMFKKFKAERPNWSAKKIWKSILISRMNVKLMTVDYTPDIGSTPLSRIEINNIINSAEVIVQDLKSFDDVVKYIIDIDNKENRFYDPSGLLADLNNILEN